MTFAEFHNGLRLLRSIDKFEIDTQVINQEVLHEHSHQMSEAEWKLFQDNPYMFFIQCEYEMAAAIYAAMQKRTKPQPPAQPEREAALVKAARETGTLFDDWEFKECIFGPNHNVRIAAAVESCKRKIFEAINAYDTPAAGAMSMTEFTKYRRSQIAELRPYQPGEPIDGISISAPDKEAGSPKPGDMIARNPKNHADQWLVAAKYFADNFEPLEAVATPDAGRANPRGLLLADEPPGNWEDQDYADAAQRGRT